MLVLEALKAFSETGRTALIHPLGSLSYRDLEIRSDAFARWLLDAAGEDRSPVVLWGDKEADLLPCLLGALKSGRAYVPIDSVIPKARAAQIVAAVDPKVVVNFTGGELPWEGRTLSP